MSFTHCASRVGKCLAAPHRPWPVALMLRVLLSALASAALPYPSFAVEPALSVERAQRLALERSRQLAADDASVRASREMAVAAAQLPDPVLRFGIDNLPVDGPDRFSVARDFMTMRRVGIAQEFTRAEKRELRGERYAREADKALAQKSATTAEIERNTALAWLERYYAEAAVAAIEAQVSRARLEVEAADSAYRAGRGSQADVFAARAFVVSLEDRASELARRVGTAKVALARWVGDAAAAPLADKPATETVPLVPESLDTQLAHHPEIAVLAKQEAIAATEARLAQAGKHADWSAEVSFSQRGSQFSNMVSIGVSVPLQWDQKQRQNRELAAKLAAAEQARAQREEITRAHAAEVGAMLVEWHSTRERAARIERELLPLSRERTRAQLAAYRGGKSSLNDVLLAWRSETEVQLQVLQLAADADRLWAQLSFLLPTGAAAAHHASEPGNTTTGEIR